MEETTFGEVTVRCLQLWVFYQSKTIHLTGSLQVALFFNSLFPGFLQGKYKALLISAVCFFRGKGGKRWDKSVMLKKSKFTLSTYSKEITTSTHP